MAGHSQFKNIMHRKSAQDKKRAKVFTKIIRELTVAARAGDDADSNPRLRTAISIARGANMPKDTMERAIKRGAGGEDDTNYTTMRYEGYGSAGVAVVVEALTDNKNRTAGEIRAAFSKYGGNLGETNSVSFQFTHCGSIRFGADKGDLNTIFEAALAAGAEDVLEEGDAFNVICAADDFHAVSVALVDQLGDPESASLIWMPQTPLDVTAEQAQKIFKLLDVLEDNDDVQAVFSNVNIDEDTLNALAE